MRDRRAGRGWQQDYYAEPWPRYHTDKPNLRKKPNRNEEDQFFIRVNPWPRFMPGVLQFAPAARRLSIRARCASILDVAPLTLFRQVVRAQSAAPASPGAVWSNLWL